MKGIYWKRKIYVPVLFCAFLLVGCSRGDKSGSQKAGESIQGSSLQDKNSDSEKAVDTAQNNVIDDDHPISEMPESMLDLSEYGLGYEFATDAQPEYLWTSIARAENGYYVWEHGDLKRLMYFDTASKAYVPLCNKPNCTHDSKSCNAFFNSTGEDDMQYISSYIQYYDGCVYIAGHDTEGDVYLFKVASDGSTCEKYMTLYKADLSSTNPEDKNVKEFTEPNVCIHRGYVYFLIGKESALRLRRMKLGEDKVEIVFENAGSRPSLYRMKAYGDYLFFQSGNFIDDDYIDIEAGIFALNVNTAQVQMVKKDAVSDFTISDGDLYYTTATGINCYSLKEKRDVTVVDTGMRGELAVVGQYIYLYSDDTCTLSQYDFSGRLLGEATETDVYQCCMGDSDYFFAYASNPGGIRILSVEELSKGTAKWTILGE